MAYKKNPRYLNQIQYCEREAIPLIVVTGEEEQAMNGVKVKDVTSQEEVVAAV